ncbi:hypothetical protein VNI00_002826 [Paramarasmius palmivorus]|uniref:T6SS Phospholipase effector Tle1-like catalytic domain-containing protein n=1 Tax=Paramarasmius palmivorus TaxID=297713 RepID=A0AAW0DWE2_9AGAR
MANAYELYCTSADEGSLSQSEHLESHEDMVSTFKETFSRAVKVHFVGAWDTVSSVGLVRSDKNLPLTTSGMKHVCYFRHALAIDERRVKFLPEFAWGSAGPNYEDCKGEMPHTKEVWFAGTHSDIGGGNIPNEELNKKKSTLRWMAREAKKAGLLLDERFDVTLKEGESQEIKESLKGIWWILEAIPFKRLKYVDAKDRDRFTFWPHLGRRRVILNSQRIHQTVYKAHRPGHKKNLPKNRRDPLNDNAELAEPEKVEEDEEEQEDEDEEEEKPADIWSLVDEMVPLVDVTTPEDLVLDRVTIFLEHVHDIEDLPIKELYEELYRLKLAENTNVAQFRAVIVMLVIYAVENRFFSVPEKGHLTAMPAIIQSLLCHTNDRFVGIAKDYIFRHYKSGIKAITTPSPVCSVSISSNGGCIALGEESNDIFVLDIINAGIIYQPLKGHTDRVTSIAFSRQGRMLVSGSDDHTVRIWRLEEKSHTTICVHHNRPEVVAVAFYRNDTHIFSASRDGTILLHDIQRGTFTILVTDSEPVVKATLSPDGSKVVVLSDSGAMRVWDTEKKICISPEYLASDDPISSVEFSVDGSRFFTGNRSGQVHIWNATGEYLDTLAKHPKEGGGTIDTLAASSKYLVANYRANMVQMWDLQVRQPGPSRLFQFSGPILCATFSPRHPSLLIVCSGNCAVEFVDVDGEFVTEILQNEGPGSPFCYFNDSKRRVISSPRRPNH